MKKLVARVIYDNDRQEFQIHVAVKGTDDWSLNSSYKVVRAHGCEGVPSVVHWQFVRTLHDLYEQGLKIEWGDITGVGVKKNARIVYNKCDDSFVIQVATPGHQNWTVDDTFKCFKSEWFPDATENDYVDWWFGQRMCEFIAAGRKVFW